MDATEAKVTLAIDVMGSDRGPYEVIAGISQSLESSPRGTRFLLFGREDVIDNHASEFENLNSNQVEIRHATEVVEMDEKPIAGIKGKKNSSMAMALNCIKEQEASLLSKYHLILQLQIRLH